MKAQALTATDMLLVILIGILAGFLLSTQPMVNRQQQEVTSMPTREEKPRSADGPIPLAPRLRATVDLRPLPADEAPLFTL